MPIKRDGPAARLRRLLASLHPFRMLRHRGHVPPRRRMTLGRDVRIAPTWSGQDGKIGGGTS